MNSYDVTIINEAGDLVHSLELQRNRFDAMASDYVVGVMIELVHEHKSALEAIVTEGAKRLCILKATPTVR